MLQGTETIVFGVFSCILPAGTGEGIVHGLGSGGTDSWESGSFQALSKAAAPGSQSKEETVMDKAVTDSITTQIQKCKD